MTQLKKHGVGHPAVHHGAHGNGQAAMRRLAARTWPSRTLPGRPLLAACAGLMTLALPLSATAALVPDAGRSMRDIESVRPALPPAQPTELDLPAARSQAAPAAALADAPRLTVSGFRLDGNQALGEDVLLPLLDDLEGKALTLADVRNTAASGSGTVFANTLARNLPTTRIELAAATKGDLDVNGAITAAGSVTLSGTGTSFKGNGEWYKVIRNAVQLAQPHRRPGRRAPGLDRFVHVRRPGERRVLRHAWRPGRRQLWPPDGQPHHRAGQPAATGGIDHGERW